MQEASDYLMLIDGVLSTLRCSMVMTSSSDSASSALDT